VGEIYLSGLDLAGHINFDTTTYVRCVIGENSKVGRDLEAAVCIDDFPEGHLIVSDGVIFQNFKTSVVATNQNFTDGNILFGRCVYNGAPGWTIAANRYIVNHRAYTLTGQQKRLTAGQIRIGTPIEITNTRTRSDGRWVTDSDARDAACVQGDDGRYLIRTSYMSTNGPPGVQSWKRGDELYYREPVAGQSSYMWVCTVAGASIDVAWLATTIYSAGTWVSNGLNVYVCVSTGTSAETGGPIGTGTGIIDGSCQWDFVDIKAVFKSVSAISV
jgi:hypothetical protein